jgi:hypothetical protein
MKLSDLLTSLNLSYYGSSDDIIITWFDKQSVSDCLDNPPDQEIIDEAWERASTDIQEQLNEFIEFYRVQYDFAETLQSAIEDIIEERERETNE